MAPECEAAAAQGAISESAVPRESVSSRLRSGLAEQTRFPADL
jgi:hypothetical protein